MSLTKESINPNEYRTLLNGDRDHAQIPVHISALAKCYCSRPDSWRIPNICVVGISTNIVERVECRPHSELIPIRHPGAYLKFPLTDAEDSGLFTRDVCAET